MLTHLSGDTIWKPQTSLQSKLECCIMRFGDFFSIPLQPGCLWTAPKAEPTFCQGGVQKIRKLLHQLSNQLDWLRGPPSRRVKN